MAASTALGFNDLYAQATKLGVPEAILSIASQLDKANNGYAIDLLKQAIGDARKNIDHVSVFVRENQEPLNTLFNLLRGLNDQVNAYNDANDVTLRIDFEYATNDDAIAAKRDADEDVLTGLVIKGRAGKSTTRRARSVEPTITQDTVKALAAYLCEQAHTSEVEVKLLLNGGELVKTGSLHADGTITEDDSGMHFATPNDWKRMHTVNGNPYKMVRVAIEGQDVTLESAAKIGAEHGWFDAAQATMELDELENEDGEDEEDGSVATAPVREITREREPDADLVDDVPPQAQPKQATNNGVRKSAAKQR